MKENPSHHDPSQTAAQAEDALLSPLLNEALAGEVLSAEGKDQLVNLHAKLNFAGLEAEPLLDQALQSELQSPADQARLTARVLAETTPVQQPMAGLLDVALAAEPMSAAGQASLERAVLQAAATEVSAEDRGVIARIGGHAIIWRSSLAAVLLLGVMGWVAAMLLSMQATGPQAGEPLTRNDPAVTLQLARLEAGLDSIALAAEQPVQDASDRDLQNIAADVEVTLIDYELEGLVHTEELDVQQDLESLDNVWLSDADLF